MKHDMTPENSVRPERSATGAKSKGRPRGVQRFDFAELRSATLNANGFGFEKGS